jgi:hypothetical protein
VRSPPSVFKEMRLMDATMIDEHLENLDRRLAGVEQILPTLATKHELQTAVATLATKDELQAAIAMLSTKEELRAAIAPLATKEELRLAVQEEGERSRRYMTVLIENQNSKLDLVAEHVLSLMEKRTEE